MFSDDWFVHVGKYGLTVVPLHEIAWVYSQGVLQTRRRDKRRKYEWVRLVCPHRQDYVLDFPTFEAVEWFAARMVERKPAVLFGDVAEYRKINRDGIAALRAVVVDREERYAKMSPEKQDEWRRDAPDDFLC